MVYRRTWLIIVSGFFEPLFYLFFFVPARTVHR